MPFTKGHKLSKGREKGSQNKITAKSREIYAQLLENNYAKMQKWLDELENPKDKLDFVLRSSEYVLPKLARTEVQGDLKIDNTYTDEQAERLLKIRNAKK